MSSIADARRELEQLAERIEQVENQMPRVRNLLNDVVSLMGLTGLKSASDVRRMIMLLWQAKAAYDAVMVARMAAGDPFAWLGFGISVGATVVTTLDMAGCYG